MKNKKLLAMSLVFISSLVACNNKVSSSNEVSSSSSSSYSETVSSSSTVSTNVESTISSSSSISSSSTSSSTVSSSSSSSTSSSTSSSEEKVLEDVIDKIELGVNSHDKVKSGTLTYNEGSDVVTNYEFGVDKYGKFVHIEEKNNKHTYYGYNASNELYGIVDTNGSYSVPLGTPSENNLLGPIISPFGYSEKDKMYGSKHFMENVLNEVKENKNKDFLNLSKESTGYKFSYGKVVKATRTYLWINTISFELEGDAFKSIEAKFEGYTSITADFEYDGVYYINDGAKVNKTITVKYDQVIGEKDAVNPHDIESYYFSSFDIKDDKGNIVGDTLTLNVDTSKDFTLENFMPTTALAAFDSISVKEETGSIKGNYMPSLNTLSLRPSVEGDFVVTLSTKKITKTINVHVDKALPNDLNVYYYVKCGSEYGIDLISSEDNVVKTYKNSEVYLKPAFSPMKADQSHKIEVLSDNKDSFIYEEVQIKTTAVGENYNDVYKVKATEVGTYIIRFTSLIDPSIYLDVEYQVSEIPDIASLLEHRYVRNTKGKVYVDVNFTPSATNYKEGSVSIDNVESGGDNNGTFKYTYNEETKYFDLTKLNEDGSIKENAEFKVKLGFNENYQLVYELGESAQELSIYSYELMISRIEWQGRDSNNAWVTFGFNQDGTGTFGYSRSDENFQVVESYHCKITYTTSKQGDDIVIELTESSKKEIYKFKAITSISSITTDDKFAELTLTLKINNKEEIVTLRQGG